MRRRAMRECMGWFLAIALALVACAADGLSAKRFDEYLSLGQVPDVTLPPQAHADEGDEEVAIVAGTLRAPWKWEELIVESSVVGGRTRGDGAARWRRYRHHGAGSTDNR